MIKKLSWSFITAFFSLLIAILALYCNWQTLLISNRPYLKITPSTIENSKEFYRINKVDLNKYDIYFKFKLQNTGHVLANHIQVQHEAGFFIKTTPDLKIKGEKTRKFFENFYKSDVIGFQPIPVGQLDDEGMKKLLEEIKSKDIVLSPRYKKWKTISLFPGEVFEYDSGLIVSGKDAGWFVENFNKIRCFELALEVFYRGSLPVIGRPYYSKYKAIFEDNIIIPYEIECY